MERIPTTIIAGDSYTFLYNSPEYRPQDGYTLHFHLKGPGSATVIATELNGQYLITLTPTLTSGLKQGIYQGVLTITNTDFRKVVATQQINVEPDPVTSTKKDLRTFNQKMLDAVEALIERRATAGQLDIIRTKIKDREVETLPHTELLKLRDIYKQKVNTEKGITPRAIQYYF